MVRSSGRATNWTEAHIIRSNGTIVEQQRTGNDLENLSQICTALVRLWTPTSVGAMARASSGTAARLEKAPRGRGTR